MARERLSCWKMVRRGSRYRRFMGGYCRISSPIEKLLHYLDLVLGGFLLLGHLLSLLPLEASLLRRRSTSFQLVSLALGRTHAGGHRMNPGIIHLGQCVSNQRWRVSRRVCWWVCLRAVSSVIVSVGVSVGGSV